MVNPVLAKALAAAAHLPGIEEGTSYGAPSLQVGGKMIVRIKDASTLVVLCPLEEKEVLVAAVPKTYFETDHYKGWPAVLVHIGKIKKTELATRIERAWRMKAPKKLIKAFDGEVPRKAKRKR